MTREDWPWCLVGLLSGSWAAYGTLEKSGIVIDSPLLSRMTANIAGGLIGWFIIGRVIRRLRKPT